MRTRPTTLGAPLFASMLLSSVTLAAADWPQWRGPDRTGVSSEAGLQATWPAAGPRLVWRVADLGAGFGTASVAGDRLYVQINRGLDDELLQARAISDGGLAWELRLGKVGNPAQKPSYPGARSTPTVTADSVYALGSDGDLVAVDRRSGKERWRTQLRSAYGGKPGEWAYAESPLVDGDVVVASPGGATALVALDARTGRERWKSVVPGNEDAAYSSAIVVTAAGLKQYVQFLQKGLVGIHAASGRLLWRYDEPAAGSAANIPSPIAAGGEILASTGMAGGGLIRITGSGAQQTAAPVYFAKRLGFTSGGAVKIGDTVYGSTSQGLLAIDWATGEIRWQSRGVGPASIAAVGGRLYLHGENGDVALVEPSPAGYQERGRFTPADRPELGPAKAWAHPVVANGRLFLRQGGVMWAYDVAAR